MVNPGDTLREVIVVGAGPAGSIAARELALRGHDVLLVEKARFPRPKTCGDGLTPRAVAALRQLGLEERVQAAGAHRIEQAVLIGPRGHAMTMPFHGLPGQLPTYGYVLPRILLDDLLRRAAQAAGAILWQDSKVVAPLQDRRGRIRGVELVQNGHRRQVVARLTILATGAAFPLLKAFGFLTRLPPVVRAVRGYWDHVDDLSPQMEFYFTVLNRTTGYAWLFPTATGQANIGLGVFPRTTGSHTSLNVRTMLERFIATEPSLQRRLDDAMPKGKPAGYPLRTDFPAMRSWQPGCIVVGEAAGLVNPVTGEGIDLAIESGLLAAQTVHPFLRHDRLLDAGLFAYDFRLRRRYGLFFRGLHLLLRRAMGPRALARLIRQGNRHPALAKRIAGINLGTTSPYTAFLPSTWYYLRKK